MSGRLLPKRHEGRAERLLFRRAHCVPQTFRGAVTIHRRRIGAAHVGGVRFSRKRLAHRTTGRRLRRVAAVERRAGVEPKTAPPPPCPPTRVLGAGGTDSLAGKSGKTGARRGDSRSPNPP